MRGRALAALVIIAVLPALLSSSSAQAQETTKDNKAKAKALLNTGHMKYQLATFKEALIDYEAAFKIYQHPAILFNIAQSHRQLGNHKKAVFFYKLYVNEWRRKNPNPPYMDEVNRHITQLKAKIKEMEKPKPKPAPAPKPTVKKTTMQLGGVPAGAAVFVDGVMRGQGPLGTALEVSPGEHRVKVTAKNHVPWEKTILAEKGKQVRVDVKLQKMAKQRSTLWLASGIATAALAVGALGVGIGFTVKHNNAEEGSDEWADSGNIGIVGFVLAGSFAVLSGVSWLMYARSGGEREEEAMSKKAGLGSLYCLGGAPVRGGGVVGVGIRF